LGGGGDNQQLFGQSGGHLGVDVTELRIPVGMTVALRSLAVALQAVARLIEQVADQGAADLVTLRLQRLRQVAHALAGPPQRRFRITACRRLDQRLEIVAQRGVPGNRRFASGSRPPDPLRGLVPRQFLQTPPDRARRNPGCHRDRRDPAITRGECLGRRNQTTAPFIEKRGHHRKPSLMGSISITTTIYGILNQVVNPYITLSKVDSLIPGRALSMFAAFGVEQLIGGGPFLIFALFWFFVGLIGWYVSPHVQPQIIEALHALLKQSSPPQPRKLAADLLGALGELMQR